MRTAYAVLLLLYPPRFRREHGEEMSRDFAAEWERRVVATGWARTWRWLLLDLARSLTACYLPRQGVTSGQRGSVEDQARRRRHRLGRSGTLETSVRDLRYAVRTAVRRPGFTAFAVLTLAVGIGSSTAIFSAVNGVLLRPLPYPEASRLVYLGVRAMSPLPFFATSKPDFLDWRRRITCLEKLGALQLASLVVAHEHEAERVQVARVSPDLFPILGATPAAGRTFTPEEFRTGAEPVVILSHGYWERRWRGDPAAVGSRFTTAGGDEGERASFRVIGVMRAGVSVPTAARMPDPDMWLALPIDGQAYASSRTNRTLRVIGRLKPGMSLEAARHEVDAVAEAMAIEFPQAYQSDGRTLGIGIASLLEMTVGDTGQALLVLLAATGLLLLIACANVASLLLARATDRGKEIALRAALGAGGRRIVRQLLTESLLLGVTGGLAGAGIAHALLAAFRALGPAGFPRLAEVTLDLRVLCFALALSALTGVLFGLAPAIAGSRVDSSAALKEGSGTSTGGAGRSRLRGGLIVAETALALVLLSGAGLLVGSYRHLRSVDPGFDPDTLLMTEVGLGDAYSSNEQRAAYFRDLQAAVESLPGVSSVSAVADPPINGYAMWGPGVFVEGKAEAREVVAHLVGSGYFTTMGMRLLGGRDITPRDAVGSQPIVVVSETAARQLWPDQDPIGKRIRLSGDDKPWLEVVGLVNDIRQEDLATPATGEIYVPYAQAAWYDWMYLVVRTDREATTMAGLLRQVMRDLDPSVPFDGFGSMSGRISASLSPVRVNALLLTVFAGMALLLAAAGIYAMMLYAVGQRSREVAIRMAVGARPLDVVRLVVRQGMGLALSGVAIGLAATVALSRTLRGLVFGVATTDPPTLVAGAGVLIAVALVACCVPARSATRVDPMAALKSE